MAATLQRHCRASFRRRRWQGERLGGASKAVTAPAAAEIGVAGALAFPLSPRRPAITGEVAAVAARTATSSTEAEASLMSNGVHQPSAKSKREWESSAPGSD